MQILQNPSIIDLFAFLGYDTSTIQEVVMVIRKRPSGRFGRKGNSRSYMDGVLYTAQRRTTTYNDIIPVTEQKRRTTLNDIIESVLSRFSNKYAYSERAQRAAAPKVKCESIFKDRTVLLTTFVCLVVVVASVIAIPVAFAKNEMTVNVMDSGRTFVAQTSAKTVGEFMKNNNIELGSQDTLDTSPDLAIKNNMDIVIRRAMPLTINDGSDTKAVSMIAGTVSEALSLAGINVNKNDEVYPSTDSYVRPGMSIDYINVIVKSVTTSQTIGYKEITRDDSNMLKGKKKVVQEGKEGELQIVTQQTYKNGVLSSSDVVSKKTVTAPVNEITAIGTALPPKPTMTSIGTVSGDAPSADQIREVLHMQATAYHDGLRTASGAYPRVAGPGQVGTVAADPSRFPYGTMLYVTGYGYCRVEDTGGFVKWPGGSNVLDLYMDADKEDSWGRRNVIVYILN
jgi:uncharacterized protein YabE (DUF348 family)/3D (Asp-Asp-Asp) domain-containing protein